VKRKRIGILLVVLGALIALGVGVFVYLQAEQASELAKQTPTVDVVVAQIPLAPRVQIPATAVALAKIPADLLPAEAATRLSDVVGKYPLTQIYKGEVVIQPKLADTAGKTGPSFSLKEGLVAIAYGGSDLLNNAGAIRAGDHVDVLMSLPLPAMPSGSSSSSASQAATNFPTVTQTFLQNVEVMQVGSFPTADQQGQGGNASARTITFQVSHQDALVLKWAKDAGGTLDLVLRHPSDVEPVTTDAVTANYIFRKFNFTLSQPLQ
jgi:pilus assembly protein CpaB